jgi:hypothetical protein
MDQLLLKPDALLTAGEPWMAGTDPYPGYRFRLIWDGQVIAGFQRLSLKSPPTNRWGWTRAAGKSPRLLILEEGLTYDRKLLRWATHWRMAVPWLKFALFWLSPRPDLWAGCFLEEQFILVYGSGCRPVDLELEKLQPDGGYLMHRLALKARRIIQERR